MSDGIKREYIPALKPAQEDDLIVELVELLQSIDINAPIARLNETTIADNNGQRIQL